MPPLIPAWVTNVLFLITILFCAFLEYRMQHRHDVERVPPILRWWPLATAGAYVGIIILATATTIMYGKSSWLSVVQLLIGLTILSGALCHNHFVRWHKKRW